jgi:hypothetical protein
MTVHTRFKQDDVTRAVRGCEKAGMRVGRVEIAPDGRIVVSSESLAPKGRRGSWDDLKNG